MVVTPIQVKTVFELMYCSVRPTFFGGPPCLSSANARPRPADRLLRIRNSVYAAPTSMPPTAIGRTMYRHTAFAFAVQPASSDVPPGM